MFEVAESNAFYRLSLIRTFDLTLWVCYAGQARQKVKEVVIMLDKEFMGDIGKKQCTKHQKELLQALRQLANALGKDKALTITALFGRLMVSVGSVEKIMSEQGNAQSFFF